MEFNATEISFDSLKKHKEIENKNMKIEAIISNFKLEAFIICTIENYFRVVGRSQGGNIDDLYVARKIWLMVGFG